MNGRICCYHDESVGSCRIDLPEEFTHTCRTSFLDALEPHKKSARKWIIDFSQVQYIDSSGLGLLILLKKSADDYGQSVVLYNPQNQVLSSLETANFQDIFNIEIQE